LCVIFKPRHAHDNIGGDVQATDKCKIRETSRSTFRIGMINQDS
jgi:hypothetical protein